MGRTARRHHLFLSGLPVSVADIVENRSAEQDRLLRDQRDLPIPTVHSDLVEILPVDADMPLSRVVEAVEQVHHGCLSGAGGTDDGDQFAWLGFERHICQDRLAWIVGKVDVLRPDVSRDGG